MTRKHESSRFAETTLSAGSARNSLSYIATLVLPVAWSSCATPGPHLPDYIPPPISSDAPVGNYCATIEINASHYARRQIAAGWVMGVLSVASIGAGTIMVATADSPSRKERVLSLSLPALGAILGYGASASFARAKDHGELASAATLALNSPEQSIKLCNEALAKWNEDGAGASAALIAAIQAKTQAEKATAKADAAQGQAIQAKTEAKKASGKADAALKAAEDMKVPSTRTE